MMGAVGAEGDSVQASVNESNALERSFRVSFKNIIQAGNHSIITKHTLSFLELLLSQIFVAKCNIFKNNTLKITKGAKIKFLF